MLNVDALCVDLVPEKPPVSITAGVNLARFNLQAGCLQQQSAAVFQRLLQPSGVLFRHHNRRPHLRGPQMVSCSPRAWSGLPMFLADQLGGYPEFKATGWRILLSGAERPRFRDSFLIGIRVELVPRE